MVDKVEVDPISRIEGHFGVKVTTGLDDGEDGDGSVCVTEANAHGNLWRGFENFLVGRQPHEAVTFTQRICGVCPVPHATAAAFAIENALGVSDGCMTFAQNGDGKGVPPRAVLIRNLVLACDFLMSHITHWYLLAAPSYVQGLPIPPWTAHYQDIQYDRNLISTNHGILADGTSASGGKRGVLPRNDQVQDRNLSHDLWSAVIKQYLKALRMRRLCHEAGALFAGRMPTAANFVAGGRQSVFQDITQTGRISFGVTNVFNNQEDFNYRCLAFRKLMVEVGNFIVQEYIPLVLILGALAEYKSYDNPYNGGKGWGAGVGNFLSWGAFPGTDDTLKIKGGYSIAGSTQLLIQGKSDTPTAKAEIQQHLRENILRSRYQTRNSDPAFVYPGDPYSPMPDRVQGVDPDLKYSYIKAPRWSVQDGSGSWTHYPMEVGPLARMVINEFYPINNTSNSFSGSEFGKLYLRGQNLNDTVISSDLIQALTNVGLKDQAKDYLNSMRFGLSTLDRHRARALEAYFICSWMLGDYDKSQNGGFSIEHVPNGTDWISELSRDIISIFEDNINSCKEILMPDTSGTGVTGIGLTEAPRGALAHFVTIQNGVISNYHCVAPTTWNGSPKDGPDSGTDTRRGPIEQALIGVPFPENPITHHVTSPYYPGAGEIKDYFTLHFRPTLFGGIEVMRVVQSFDPCTACAVH